MSTSPIRVHVVPAALEAARAVHGRGLAAAVRALLIEHPEEIDLSRRRYGQGGHRDARFAIRLNADTEAVLDSLSASSGLSRGDLLARAVEALA